MYGVRCSKPQTDLIIKATEGIHIRFHGFTFMGFSLRAFVTLGFTTLGARAK